MKIDERLKTLADAWEVTSRHGLGRPHLNSEPFKIATALLKSEDEVATLKKALKLACPQDKCPAFTGDIRCKSFDNDDCDVPTEKEKCWTIHFIAKSKKGGA